MTECVKCLKFKWCDLSNPYKKECADYKESVTNFDRITASIESLAKFIELMIFESYVCGVEAKGITYWEEYITDKYGIDTTNVVEWLKQESTE